MKSVGGYGDTAFPLPSKLPHSRERSYRLGLPKGRLPTWAVEARSELPEARQFARGKERFGNESRIRRVGERGDPLRVSLLKGSLKMKPIFVDAIVVLGVISLVSYFGIELVFGFWIIGSIVGVPLFFLWFWLGGADWLHRRYETRRDEQNEQRELIGKGVLTGIIKNPRDAIR